MGLGKTHQAIALVAAVAASEGRPPRVLVTCPASVLPHWEDKLRALVPGLPVHRHLGSERQERVPAGILLTTYGTLRNDAGRFAGAAGSAPLFDLFLLDEIHTIKNRDSATHQALRQVSARLALGLTGTPVENRVEELHTLLDFVLPGYLPERLAFERSFARPIAEGDPQARSRLARLVRPFVLRRTKEQVLTTLPEKIEDRRTCQLLAGQAELYQQTLAQRGGVLRSVLGAGGAVPYLHVFALLSRLKQICNHPALLAEPSPSAADPPPASSGKWELFLEVLSEALGSGLKVVVFSQYLRMLDLLAAHLEASGIGYATLRGATRDRAAPVARFREDPDCRVFLASLKAAGVGIDLTAASVVIHYDRWWNQAREDQATDRVHRIGQQRGVQVITLITAGTIEERIDRLIADKARLAHDLVPEDDARLFQRFSREELAALIAP
jgi:SNF2 family DNA or RNA helicase